MRNVFGMGPQDRTIGIIVVALVLLGAAIARADDQTVAANAAAGPALWQSVEAAGQNDPSGQPIVEAVHKLSRKDFDGFMNKMGSMADKLARGQMPVTPVAAVMQATDNADAQAEVLPNADGTYDAPVTQTADDFFKRPTD